MGDDYNGNERRSVVESPLERHFQTGISTVLIGLVIWVGLSVSKSQETIARLDERVSWLTTEVRGFRSGSTNHMSIDLADKKFNRIQSRMQNIELKIERMKGGSE